MKMKTTKPPILVLCIIFSTCLLAEKVRLFPDLVRPRMIGFTGNQFFVSDQNSLCVFDSRNFKPIARMGKKGQGPREITSTPIFFVSKTKIYLFDYYKILIYSRDFEYIDEIKSPLQLIRISRIEDGFVISHRETIGNTDFETYSIFDNKLQKKVDLLKEEIPKNEGEYLLEPMSMFRCLGNKTFISQPGKGFVIEVFDGSGKKLYSIEKKLAGIRSSETHRERFLELVQDGLGKRKFNSFKDGTAFHKKPIHKYLPDIDRFWVTENRIYIKTFDLKGDMDKYIVLDLKGKILAEKWLPNTRAVYLKSTFFNDRFYYLKENDNGEGWELHSEKM